MEKGDALQNDKSVDFLIAEYNQVYSEIRNANDKVISISKYYIGLFSSLIIFIFLGIRFYVENIDKTKDKINLEPAFYIYSIIGIVLTLTLYFIGYIGIRQIAVSKKHRVRYWKAIHAVRYMVLTLYPRLTTSLILPTNSTRPNISTGERITPYIFGLINIVFASMLFWFIFIVCSIKKSELIYTPPVLLNSLSFFMWYVITAFILLPQNCTYYLTNLYTARKIRFDNVFPKSTDLMMNVFNAEWKKKPLRRRHFSLVLSVYAFNLLNSTYDLLLPSPGICVYKISAWLMILLLIFLIGLIYVYPYFRPRTICFLCKHKIMPSIYDSSKECDIVLTKCQISN